MVESGLALPSHPRAHDSAARLEPPHAVLPSRRSPPPKVRILLCSSCRESDSFPPSLFDRSCFEVTLLNHRGSAAGPAARSVRERACRRPSRRCRRRTRPWRRWRPARPSPASGGLTPACRSSFPSHVCDATRSLSLLVLLFLS